MRLLILMALVYFGYRAVKRWLNPRMVPQNGSARRPEGEIEDVMVQDPQCGVYFPRREGIPLQQEGDTLYFCSAACRDAYLSEKKSG